MSTQKTHKSTHKSKQDRDRTLETRLWIPAHLGPGTGELILRGPSLLGGERMVCAPQGGTLQLSTFCLGSQEGHVCDLSLVSGYDRIIRHLSRK